MGDADSEIIVPVPEIQTWMDEALEIVDEGLDHLFLYMINVNDRTKQILQKLKSIDNFKQWFFALNLLIVPVVMSILICFSTRNTIDSDGLEEWLQLAVAFLMFLSGSIGLPLYVYSMWESYRCAEKLKAELGNMRQCVPRAENGRLDRTHLSEDSFLTFASNEVSVERLNYFARLLSDRIPGGIRTNAERRLSVQLSESNDNGSEEVLSATRSLSCVSKPDESIKNEDETSNDGKEDIQDSNTNTQENIPLNIPEIHKLSSKTDSELIEAFSNELFEVIPQPEELDGKHVANELDTCGNNIDLLLKQQFVSLTSPNLLSEFENKLDDVRLSSHSINTDDFY